MVHSWSRRRLRPELGGAGPGYMAMIGARRSTADWVANNLAIDLIGPGRGTVERVRYEALMRAPERELRRMVGDWLAWPGDGGGEDPPARIAIGTQHTVAGHPIRFQQDGITLPSDAAAATGRGGRRDLAAAAALRLRSAIGPVLTDQAGRCIVARDGPAVWAGNDHRRPAVTDRERTSS